jgi:hypothetical protein
MAGETISGIRRVIPLKLRIITSCAATPRLELESNNSTPRMGSSGMLRRVALVGTDVSEELSTSFIKETRIGELRRMLALTSNRKRCSSFTAIHHRD